MDVGIFYSLHNIGMHLIYIKDSLFYPFDPTNCMIKHDDSEKIGNP